MSAYSMVFEFLVGGRVMGELWRLVEVVGRVRAVDVGLGARDL